MERSATVSGESPRATLKTLAVDTGLAVATVSRALKDAPDISSETKTRVREAALRLGYRQNRAAVRLRTGKTNVIALVLSAEADVMNHTSRLIYSIAKALRGTQYHLVVMPYFADQDLMDSVRYLVETESADGVILNQTRPDDPRIRYLAEHDFPFATHGRTAMGIEHPYYDFDNEAFSRLAVRSLVDRGRRRLFLIAPPVDQNYARHMRDGFLAEAARLGVHAEIAEGYNSDSGANVIEDAVFRRFGQTPAPDGIISGSTTGAMAATAGIERTGRIIGRDFDIVSKEAIPFLHRFRREMLVVHEDVGEAGDFLARALVAAIERNAAKPGQVIEIPKSVERADTP